MSNQKISEGAQEIFFDVMSCRTMSEAIERQEKRGQRDLEKKSMMPKHARGVLGIGDDEYYERLRTLGFTIGDSDDDVLMPVVLPNDWSIVPTDHSMWSNLIDEKGRKRASIFYKAAFYDRSAHIGWNTRFTFREQPEDNYESNLTYEERNLGKWRCVIWDCGREIFATYWIQVAKLPNETVSDHLMRLDGEKKKQENLCNEWLAQRFPDWRNDAAYWD